MGSKLYRHVFVMRLRKAHMSQNTCCHVAAHLFAHVFRHSIATQICLLRGIDSSPMEITLTWKYKPEMEILA